MRSITCTSCGKRYDYDADDFCPKCGSYNPPPARQGLSAAPRPQPSRPHQPARPVSPHPPAGRSTRPAAAPPRATPSAAPLHATPAAGRSGSVRARPAPRFAPFEETPKRSFSPLALGAVVLFAVTAVILAAALIGTFSAGETPDAPEPEPDPTGPHEQYEAFSMHGWSVTVEDVWEPDLPDSVHIPQGRCAAVDLWISGGSRVSGASFATPYLVLEDGSQVDAADGDALLSRQLKNAGIYDVVPADAQWDDPLYGQIVFFLPQDAAGSVVLVLPGASVDGAAAPLHTIPLELPWQASQSAQESGQ